MNQNDDGTNGLDLPASLDRKKTLSAKEYAAEVQRSKDAVEKARDPVPVMPAPKAKRELTPLEAKRVEDRKTKRRVREERKAASATGETARMPLQGRAALAAIQNRPSQETTVKTTTKTKTKLPVPQPKSTQSVLGSKAAARKIGEEAVKEAVKNGNGITKVATGVTGAQARKTAKAAEKTAAAKPEPKAKQPKAKAKNGGGRKGAYDWESAEKLAKSGKVPPLPGMVSYQIHMADIFDYAKRGKSAVKELKDYMTKFVDEKGGRANMFRYYRLCLQAMR